MGLPGMRERGEERIPDQASEEYRHNPGNPILGVCGQCNGGSPSAEIRLGPKTIPRSKDGFDQDQARSPDGEWAEYWQIAQRYPEKVQPQDREDLRHNIVVRLFEVARARKARGKPSAT